MEEPKLDEAMAEEPELEVAKAEEPKLEAAKAEEPKAEEPLIPTTKTHRGHIVLDATVAPSKIKYPTDINLLETSRVKTDVFIDQLCRQLGIPRADCRTYRRVGRAEYLNISKKKRKAKKEIQESIGRQLNYLRRNLLFIKDLIDMVRLNNPEAILEGWREKDIRQYDTIQQIYKQQKEMYDEKKNHCEDRIVSIHQPLIRPIVRDKAQARTEFGAKIGLCTYNGITTLDNFSWDAYNENVDFKTSIEKYFRLYNVYPETVNADRIYLTKVNRAYAKQLGIRVIGKPLGRPKKTEKTSKEKLAEQKELNNRNSVEGKIGQGKNRFGLDKIPAQTDATNKTWITCCLIATNIARLLKELWGESFRNSAQMAKC